MCERGSDEGVSLPLTLMFSRLPDIMKAACVSLLLGGWGADSVSVGLGGGDGCEEPAERRVRRSVCLCCVCVLLLSALTVSADGPPLLSSESVLRLFCHLVVFCPYCISTHLLWSICCSKKTPNKPAISVEMSQHGGGAVAQKGGILGLSHFADVTQVVFLSRKVELKEEELLKGYNREVNSLSHFKLCEHIDNNMDSLQVSIACLLVKMTFVPGAVLSCPTCPTGYFMVKNCSKTEGIQCRDCTDCSAPHQVTLSLCTPWTDTVCGNHTVTTVMEKTAEPAATVSSNELMIILSVTSVFVFLVLALVLMLLSHRYKQNKGLFLP